MAYQNEKLQTLLEILKKEDNEITRSNVIDQLLFSPLYVPATWDKDPKPNAQGKLEFAPDVQLSLLTIQTTDGRRFFPMFTSHEEAKKWSNASKAKFLLLGFDQYVPFVEMAKDEIKGIVIDPFGVNTPFQAPFLIGLKDRPRKVNLKETKIEKGERVNLRNPVGDVSKITDALIRYGKEHSFVRSIYFKERLVKDQPSHWFVIVDMDPEEPRFFQEMGHLLAKDSQGKQFEFMFAGMKLAQDIMKNNEPIYVAEPETLN